MDSEEPRRLADPPPAQYLAQTPPAAPEAAWVQNQPFQSQALVPVIPVRARSIGLSAALLCIASSPERLEMSGYGWHRIPDSGSAGSRKFGSALRLRRAGRPRAR